MWLAWCLWTNRGAILRGALRAGIVPILIMIATACWLGSWALWPWGFSWRLPAAMAVASVRSFCLSLISSVAREVVSANDFRRRHWADRSALCATRRVLNRPFRLADHRSSRNREHLANSSRPFALGHFGRLRRQQNIWLAPSARAGTVGLAQEMVFFTQFPAVPVRKIRLRLRFRRAAET